MEKILLGINRLCFFNRNNFLEFMQQLVHINELKVISYCLKSDGSQPSFENLSLSSSSIKACIIGFNWKMCAASIKNESKTLRKIAIACLLKKGRVFRKFQVILSLYIYFQEKSARLLAVLVAGVRRMLVQYIDTARVMGI